MPKEKEETTPDISEDDEIIIGDDTEDDTEDDEVIIDTDEDEGEPALSEVEQIAAEMGWKQDYDGQDKVDASEFLRKNESIRRSQYNTNKHLREEMERLRNSVKETKDFYKRIEDKRAKEHEKEITKLKKLRRSAIEEGDVERVEELDEELDQHREEAEAVDTEETTQPDPAFYTWQAENPWYGTDVEMTGYADKQADRPEYNGLAAERALPLILADMKKAFPDKFNGTQQNQRKPDVPKVEPTKLRSASRTPTVSDMTPDQRRVMNSILRADPDLKEKDYIKRLKELGEL